MADVHHKRCPKDMDPMWGQCACDVIDGLLTDLRAKVEGLRIVESRVKGRRITVLVDRADVIALFDEAQPTQRTLRVELEDDDANISE